MSEPLAGGESLSLGICLNLRERGALQEGECGLVGLRRFLEFEVYF